MLISGIKSNVLHCEHPHVLEGNAITNAELNSAKRGDKSQDSHPVTISLAFSYYTFHIYYSQP